METDKPTDPIEEFTGGKRVKTDPGLAKRLWRQWAETIITVAIIGLYALVVMLFNFLGNIEDKVDATQEQGNHRLAVDCQQLFIDDDRTAPITDDCTQPGVMKYYPAEICRVMGATGRDGCGTAFEPSPYQDPPVR